MAWNDPGEKRNPWNRQKPPHDLDEILRNIQRWIANLFGHKGSAGSAGNGGGQKTHAVLEKGLATALVLIGALWIGSGLYRVDAQERAVILRFGKYIQTTGPGYNWHWPWPIERKITVNVSHLYSVTDEESILTADTNLVEVKSAVQYTQPDPLKLLFKVRNVDETLTQVSESAMREAVGQASLDKALAFDPAITQRAKVLLQRTLDSYDMGIHIVSVNLTDVNVPEPVQEAQRDAIKADKDRQRYQQEAQTYRNDLLPRARGEAAKMLQDASAYQAKVVDMAQGDTARFDQVYAQYQKAPAVTRERMYLGTMEQVYKNSRKVLIDTKGGNNVMYLPLDKLISPPPPAAPTDIVPVTPLRTPESQSAPADAGARARGVR